MARNNREETIIPTVSYSLAAIVRKKKKKQQQPNDTKQTQEYVLVHEHPPRGWWLPGGGVEHHDLTPVDAAIRETVEEAGCATLLPLLPSFETSSTTNDDDDYTSKVLPSMTHLITLEQSPGRIRFIFRGEWVDDDSIDNSILKCIPDDESIEAKWVTYDEVQCLEERKRGSSNKTQNRFGMSNPWLRGHEPKTFFGLLERSWQEDEAIPGLQVHKMNLSGDTDIQQEDVTGAFFGRCTDTTSEKVMNDLNCNGRAALLTHLKCHLIVYNKLQKVFTIDTSFVSNQNELLKELVGGMLARYTSLSYEENDVGLLRVEHVIHDNGREATLTVYPFVYLFATDVAHEATSWVSIDELSALDRRLAEIVMDDARRRGICLNLDILRDTEGPRKQKHIPNDLSAQDRAWLRNVGS